MNHKTLTITADVDRFIECLNTLSQPEIPREVVDRLLSALKVPDQLVSIDFDLSTASTSECRIVFKPSDLLLDLVATLTRDSLKLVVEYGLHSAPPVP